MTLDNIELPDDLLWVNEFDWNPVEQNIERSLSGALLVQEQKKLQGRPIILSGGDDFGWVKRSTVLELQKMGNDTNHVMLLIMQDQREFDVIFNRTVISPIKAQQILPSAYCNDETQYSLHIQLLSVTSPI